MKNFKLKMENAASIIVTDVEENKEYEFNNVTDIPVIEECRKGYSQLDLYLSKAIAFCFGYKNNYKDDEFTIEFDISCFQHFLIQKEVKSLISFHENLNAIMYDLILSNYDDDNNKKHNYKRIVHLDFTSCEESLYSVAPSYRELLDILSNGATFDTIMFSFDLDYFYIEKFLIKHKEAEQFLPE